jgi:hypothetical protein
MADIAYLIQVDLKKQLAAPADDSRTWLVLPPAESKLSCPDAAEIAFNIVVEAVRDTSRHAVIEEIWRRRVFVEDLRPYRNAYVFEKDGWRCVRVM